MSGYHGKLVHTEKITLVSGDVEKNAVVPEQHHIHEQIMHVIEGDFNLLWMEKPRFIIQKILCQMHQTCPKVEKH